MAREDILILKRRFTGRVLESGLLILAVALGVGVASSGLSLFFHTKSSGEKTLSLPEYKEIIITSRENMVDMEAPVLETVTGDDIALTTKDLKAGELVTPVTYSYILSNSRLRLTTGDFPGPGGEPGAPQGGNSSEGEATPGDQPGQPPEGMEPPEGKEWEEIDLENTPDLITTEIEEINGYEVTSEFFYARGLDTSQGSIFTESEYTSSENSIILGSEIAAKLIDEIGSEIIGKKLASRNRLYIIVGILKKTDTKLDNYFISPKKEVSSDSRFFGRGPGMDSQLRFYISDPTQLETGATQLEEWFKTQYGDSQIVVSNPRAQAIKVLNRNNGISTLILFLSLAGLFIAAVNVSNILMSRSMRMRKHVGILKALGASRKTIVELFASEAIFITAIGSLLGVLFSIPLSKTMEESMNMGAISPLYIAIGGVISTLLTLLFSVMPARLNSKTNPADAMRA